MYTSPCGKVRSEPRFGACEGNGIVDALAEAGISCWADKGYQGDGGAVRVPYRGRWETLSAGQQAVN